MIFMRRSPDSTQQMPMGQRPPGVSGEFGQNREFLGRQVHRRIIAAHGMTKQIDHQWPTDDRLLILSGTEIDEVVDIELESRRLGCDGTSGVLVPGIAAQAARTLLDGQQSRLHVLPDQGEQQGTHPVTFP